MSRADHTQHSNARNLVRDDDFFLPADSELKETGWEGEEEDKYEGLNVTQPCETEEENDDSLTYEELKNRRVIGTENMEFPDEALYGLAGRIVRKILPETETHPAALLMHILVRYGSIVGRRPYFQVEDTRHYANEFCAITGKTSDARKGTAHDRIGKVFERLDEDWEDHCCMSGFGSGEGLIKRIAEESDAEVSDDRILRVKFPDPRVFIREGELSSILSVSSREGNILGPTLRNAWDGKNLENNTVKGTLIAANPHVSAIGDITVKELRKLLSEIEKNNGSANRWAFMFVERTRVIPEANVRFDWSKERQQLMKAIKFGKSRRRMFRTEAARVLWARRYKALTAGGDDSIASMTSRAPAHVARWSMIFALLDCSTHIESKHLRAALALWDYSKRSVLHIFNTFQPSKEQSKIIDYLKTSGGATVCDIRQFVFSRNKKVKEIEAILATLEKAKVAGFNEENAEWYA
jgi:hypothetical protein